jgi:hypothetical protein
MLMGTSVRVEAVGGDSFARRRLFQSMLVVSEADKAILEGEAGAMKMV